MTGGDQDRYVIDGRFELLQRLGGGGMGLVWRARDLMLQREVALKEVRSPDPSVHGSDPGEQAIVRERVLREAQALARLQHPNVVTIFHIVDSRELAHPWLVMELVTGGALDSLLDERDLTVPEALRIGRGLLGALRAAHAAGIQHRDVKPANVLLRDDGTPVLTDFGIAALEAQPGLTATGMLIGSPEYMAPERVHGVEGDPRSDLWSLGLMLYVGLEGRNPLSRETTIATIAAVSEGYVPPPVRSGPLGPVLSALLVPDPSRRPSAEQLDAMFAQVEAGGSISAFQQTIPAPRMADSDAARDYGEWLTRQFGNTGQQQVPNTDQLPGGSGPRRPVNPYGDGGGATGNHAMANQGTGGHGYPYAYDAAASRAADQRYRNKAIRLSAISTTAVLGIMGFSIWATTRAENHASNLGSDAAITTPTFFLRTPSDAPSSAGSASQDSTSTGAPTAAAGGDDSAALKHLLTPAGVRAVIKQIFAVSGGNRVVSMSIYDDHASFDVVKKDDPTVYDTYSFSNGEAQFSMTGETLDKGEPALDPYTVNWDALPKLLSDANSTLNVKNPNYHYVLVDSDIIDHTLSMKVYIGDDYRSGYLSADLKGKIQERYPQE